MLKVLITTLKAVLDTDGMASNELRDKFSYLIKDSMIYMWYQMKFEINRANFRSYAKEHLDDSYFENKEQFNEFLDILQGWYNFYLDNNKSLVNATSSLKSDCKKFYKKYINSDLKGFDRFMEEVRKLFEEAFNKYDIVFYNPEAIWHNDFSEDRGSCYINSRQEYYDVIKQLPAFYIMIYKNGEPLTRYWGLLSADKKYFVFFNSYGYKFKEPYKFFGNKEEFTEVFKGDLQDVLNIYINSGEWYMSKEADTEDFIFNISCPNCGNFTATNYLEWVDGQGLRCEECDGLVYSEYYGCKIRREDAVYSNIFNSYLYADESCYSYYYDDYIPESKAYRVYNVDYDGTDFVLQDDAVYSEFHDCWLIKSQTVFSEYYDSYIVDDRHCVFSNYLQSYVYKNDNNIIFIGYDYIPKEDLEYFIKYNNMFYQKLKLASIRKFNIALKPLKVLKVLKVSY